MARGFVSTYLLHRRQIRVGGGPRIHLFVVIHCIFPHLHTFGVTTSISWCAAKLAGDIEANIQQFPTIEFVPILQVDG